ncbi:MAG: hypothetical protein AB203_02820 [Parcubacteria bacterium C7867-008]|nr:MAG: hypothetical protein AB203_02820 [Parcubacteria bacterium C7867-008]
MTIHPPVTSQSRTYQYSPNSQASVTALHPSIQFFVRDRATWESFDRTDLTAYLFDGAVKAAAQIERIAYMDQPYTKQDQENLAFMVESLLHARGIADEIK